jgi:hypothetical protein
MSGDTSLPVPEPPRNGGRLRALDRVNVIMPPEVTLPVTERVYAHEPQILDNPMVPTDRDVALVERLGSLMCEPAEVLAITGLTKEQFNITFSPVWARGRERAKARLRLMQWDAAAMGSERMLVHLGKQYLDQTEKVEKNELDATQRAERLSARDKLANALDRAGKRRAAEQRERDGAGVPEEGVVAVGEGQPAPAA